MKAIIKYLTLFILVCIIFQCYWHFPHPDSLRLLNIQNYVITAAGIISGIVIAYLSTKLFNIKQERERRHAEILKLSHKLTNYRALLYCVMRSHGFWKYYKSIDDVRVRYPNLNFFRIHDYVPSDQEAREYHADETIFHSTVDLFFAMAAIYGEFDKIETWIHNRTISFSYSVQELNNFLMPCEQISYYLEIRYGKHLEGEIDDTNIWIGLQTHLRNFITQIDPKFSKQEFNRHLLATISNEFSGYYLPKLIQLTSINTSPLPKSVRKLFGNLIFIFIVGVILPLFIQSIVIPDYWNIYLTQGCVGLICISFFNFLFDFYSVISEEIEMQKN